jgi:hypothetical protein
MLAATQRLPRPDSRLRSEGLHHSQLATLPRSHSCGCRLISSYEFLDSHIPKFLLCPKDGELEFDENISLVTETADKSLLCIGLCKLQYRNGLRRGRGKLSGARSITDCDEGVSK